MIKSPRYQIMKSSLGCFILYVGPQATDIGLPAVDEHVSTLSKVVVDTVLFAMRKGMYVGVDLVDVVVVIVLLVRIRKNQS